MFMIATTFLIFCKVLFKAFKLPPSELDWNSVTLSDNAYLFTDGSYYTKTGQKITWLESEEQKAIDKLNQLITTNQYLRNATR